MPSIRHRNSNGRYNRLFEGKGVASLNMRMDSRFQETVERLLETGVWTNPAELLFDLTYRFSRVEHPEWDLPVLPVRQTEQEKRLDQFEEMVSALQLNV